ncbi:hypothetical protein OS493_012442 [Desmophyllum pertusum]|uniref:Uncharacterized protein n=1 Tax=Desmophyllum pertusum TaxID=174260 RepID=A0A9X0D5Y7_9CNID|nr:hypothetical protein OS493_012442 [Desmophyllum pertusum]
MPSSLNQIQASITHSEQRIEDLKIEVRNHQEQLRSPNITFNIEGFINNFETLEYGSLLESIDILVSIRQLADDCRQILDEEIKIRRWKRQLQRALECQERMQKRKEERRNNMKRRPSSPRICKQISE